LGFCVGHGSPCSPVKRVHFRAAPPLEPTFLFAQQAFELHNHKAQAQTRSCRVATYSTKALGMKLCLPADCLTASSQPRVLFPVLNAGGNWLCVRADESSLTRPAVEQCCGHRGHYKTTRWLPQGVYIRAPRLQKARERRISAVLHPAVVHVWSPRPGSLTGFSQP